MVLMRWANGQRPRPAHWLAGAFLAAALVCINTAFAVMPIVNALAIFFVEPLVLTILSVFVVGRTHRLAPRARRSSQAWLAR